MLKIKILYLKIFSLDFKLLMNLFFSYVIHYRSLRIAQNIFFKLTQNKQKKTNIQQFYDCLNLSLNSIAIID